MNKRITEIFVFAAVDPANDIEGVVSADTAMGHMPLLGADMTRIESLRPIAQKIARAAGVKVKLIKFSVREDLEEL